jgi:hypothetical protein
MVASVLAAGCVIPINKNTTAENPGSYSPTDTLSVETTPPAVTQTTALDDTSSSPDTRTGQLNVSIGDYNAEPPATVFIDNASVGTVSRGNPLDLTPAVGVHTVRICVIGACLEEEVLVISSSPITIDFGERLKKEAVTGPLRVSIGGYNAELPVFIDNASVGNVSMTEPLNMMVREGNHTVRVCVGILCVNETVAIKFAQPVYIDFGERLKKVAEFPIPTVQIIDTRRSGNTVTVDVEFINPTRQELSMSATVELAYSYIDPQTHWRKGSSTKRSVAQLVKAGARSVQSVSFTMTGGSAYIIEIPVILDSSSA